MINEMDLLDYFYDELRVEGKTRETLFISLDELVATKLSQKIGSEVQLADLHKFADNCIANEWLERTTADQEYKYLSLSASGLQVAIAYQYKSRKEI